MLSPFETYDLLFVRELVNNLNKDNEILNCNIDDLKAGFMFLYDKHKELIKAYNKERSNHSVMDLQRKRIAELMQEKDKIGFENLQLRYKISSMNEIMRIAIDE